MSYNVDSARVLKGQLWISREGREWVDGDVEGDTEATLPENTPEWECPQGNYTAEEQALVERGYAKIPNGKFWWSGSWSGNAVHEGTWKKFLSFTLGSADILLTWEGGDCFSGYRVVDGVTTEHEVVMVLGDPIDGEPKTV